MNVNELVGMLLRLPGHAKVFVATDGDELAEARTVEQVRLTLRDDGSWRGTDPWEKPGETEAVVISV